MAKLPGAVLDEVQMKEVAEIQRADPAFKETVVMAANAVMLTLNCKQGIWEKTGVEGSFYVYKRAGDPEFIIIIINNLGNNFVHTVTRKFNFFLGEELLELYVRKNIYGVQFNDIIKCTTIAEILKQILIDIKKQPKCRNITKGGPQFFGDISDSLKMIRPAKLENKSDKYEYDTNMMTKNVAEFFANFAHQSNSSRQKEFSKSYTSKTSKKSLPTKSSSPIQNIQLELNNLMRSTKMLNIKDATLPTRSLLLNKSSVVISNTPIEQSNPQIQKEFSRSYTTTSKKSLPSTSSLSIQDLQLELNNLMRSTKMLNIKDVTVQPATLPTRSLDLIEQSNPQRQKFARSYSKMGEKLVPTTRPSTINEMKLELDNLIDITNMSNRSTIEKSPSGSTISSGVLKTQFPVTETSCYQLPVASAQESLQNTNVVNLEALSVDQLVKVFTYMINSDPDILRKLHEAYTKSVAEIVRSELVNNLF